MQSFPITTQIQTPLNSRLVPVMNGSRPWLDINKIEIPDSELTSNNRKRQCALVEPD